MEKVKFPDTALSMEMTGALGVYRQWLRGDKTFAEIVAENPYAGIYRKQRIAGKNTLVRFDFYAPYNPKTVPQQAWRAVFTAGVAAYHALTSDEKVPYTMRAKRLRLTAFNVYMSDWLKSHRT